MSCGINIVIGVKFGKPLDIGCFFGVRTKIYRESNNCKYLVHMSFDTTFIIWCIFVIWHIMQLVWSMPIHLLIWHYYEFSTSKMRKDQNSILCFTWKIFLRVMTRRGDMIPRYSFVKVLPFTTIIWVLSNCLGLVKGRCKSKHCGRLIDFLMIQDNLLVTQDNCSWLRLMVISL